MPDEARKGKGEETSGAWGRQIETGKWEGRRIEVANEAARSEGEREGHRIVAMNGVGRSAGEGEGRRIEATNGGGNCVVFGEVERGTPNRGCERGGQIGGGGRGAPD